jgi:hypothetical protein
VFRPWNGIPRIRHRFEHRHENHVKAFMHEKQDMRKDSTSAAWRKFSTRFACIFLLTTTACDMQSRTDSPPHAVAHARRNSSEKIAGDAAFSRNNCRTDKDGVLLVCRTDFDDLSNEMQYNTPFYGAIHGVVERDDSGFRLTEPGVDRSKPRSLRISQDACARMTPPDDCAGIVGREVTAFGLIHTVHAADQRSPKDGMQLTIFMTHFMNGREGDAYIENAGEKSQ